MIGSAASPSPRPSSHSMIGSMACIGMGCGPLPSRHAAVRDQLRHLAAQASRSHCRCRGGHRDARCARAACIAQPAEQGKLRAGRSARRRQDNVAERWCAGKFLREVGADSKVRRDLTVKVDAPVGYQSREFVTHLFDQLCDAVERYAKNHASAIDNAKSSDRMSISQKLRRLARARVDRGSRPPTTSADLIRMARTEREAIRYVQSRTTERELSVGAPPVAGRTWPRASCRFAATTFRSTTHSWSTASATSSILRRTRLTRSGARC